jgi:hypothetical protein
MSRTLRYLRIVFSCVCGIACVLLVVLWVRSYWCSDRVQRFWPTGFYLVTPANGVLHFAYGREEIPLTGGTYWSYDPRKPSLPHRQHTGFTSNGWQIYVPFWLMLPFVVAICLAPWVPWSKRFTMRGLLLITLVIACMLGLVVMAFRN